MSRGIDEKWTPHETNYLFSLLKAYDLRFLVVTDRYAYIAPGGKTGQDEFTGDYAWPMIPPGLARKKKKVGAGAAGSTGANGSGGSVGLGETVRRSSRMGQGQNSRGATPLPSSSGSASVNVTAAPVVPPMLVETEVKTRSMEEIKDRYYTVCRRLLRNRPAVDEAFKERMVKAYDYDLREYCVGGACWVERGERWLMMRIGVWWWVMVRPRGGEEEIREFFVPPHSSSDVGRRITLRRAQTDGTD